MAKFPAHAVLSTSTGVLLGDIGGVYQVTSFLIGRSAFTHDLAYHGKRASAALRAALPAIPGPGEAAHVTADNYRAFLADWEKELGDAIELPESLRDSLADDKNPIETATEMVGKDRVVVVETK